MDSFTGNRNSGSYKMPRISDEKCVDIQSCIVFAMEILSLHSDVISVSISGSRQPYRLVLGRVHCIVDAKLLTA
jgi:hypothetical protein